MFKIQNSKPTLSITTNDIRKLYLDFFKSKGHTIIPSASLIPENDPTVLFTTAGMHPLVPYLLGEPHPGGHRLASAQKCVRTGDIDEVGDNRHLTFFEMLGNWSLGDYFKKEAIAFSFEFLTSKEWLAIEPTRFFVSVFEGDDDAPKDKESISYWQENFKSAGINADVGDWKKGISGDSRIFTYPKSKNWWGPAGETGPCGPDTEMFYDTLNLPDKSKHTTGWTGAEPCHPNCDCGRYVEMWNDVFMQYNKNKNGTFEPLKQQNVDTGMGLERTVAVLNQTNIFEVEEFKKIISSILTCAGVVHEEKNIPTSVYPRGFLGHNISEQEAIKAVRIIADHIRAAVFILGDECGVLPSNIGQGYVLRRLIRRAVRYGKLMGITGKFTRIVAEKVIELFGETYHELSKNSEKILSEIEKEEEKFAAALTRGLKEFEKLSAVNGKTAFALYQSYGFPLELTEEMAKEKGIEINKKTFEEEFKKHQELSRTEGSNITKERLRFDFSHPQKMTFDELSRAESIVNEKIKENLPIGFEMLPVEEAKKRGAIGLFEEKYKIVGEKVKMYSIGNYSIEICGGPHVKATGEIGQFKIIKEEAVASGIRRIKAIIL
ncbi:MAG: Alanine-tRNA ligase [Candidatus Jorgensenbacteria bacterium GW2011_GWA2_45_9]|uniref:alanine--tRNA ligase n=1 Tax=Candidatus Jorgensenbacteria bacterium GW2011_GWA2_45_9 TaxID=1618663 RepID=A0A0G1N495_9BACT|nr:MAG: Alanine-tRNA ligase [Candidatus Jorgensenbacteria bacterium GW2011_GWA2_45_9]